MSRAKWKGPFLDIRILKSFIIKSTWTRLWSRRSRIPSTLMGKKVFVYNGQRFKPMVITREKIGFKFGEFATSHQRYGRKKKKKKK